MSTSFNTHINNYSRSGNKNKLLKVIILGDGLVGKSCLMNRFVNNQFDSHSSLTVGVEFFNKEIEINGEYYTLQIWDTAGQERFKSLRSPFYRGSDICMLTYAINSRDSFTNLTTWRNEFLYYADVKNPDIFPFLVVGNKLDLAQDKRQVETSYAKRWSFENGDLPFIETSAKDATNVTTAFTMAVERWLRLEDSMDKVDHYEGTSITLKNHKTIQSRSSCCLK